jgi:hypothetical protein
MFHFFERDTPELIWGGHYETTARDCHQIEYLAKVVGNPNPMKEPDG